MSDKPRVLSGVQPTGTPHLGNYLGAIAQWTTMVEEYDTYFCVVDLHALTLPETIKAEELRAKSLSLAALYIACGVDPTKATIFVQSEVTAHSELSWILQCMTPLSWLHRMTQFKSKSDGKEGIGTGLLCYPVLQAADILLYDADLVPVGADQKQHIELTRDIAERFNHMFGETFHLPKPMIREAGARVMGLDTPEQKMSKSSTVPGHAIGLLDGPKQVKKKIMRAVTDTGCEYRPDEASPGVRNLLNIYAAISGETAAQVGERFAGQGYGYLKKDLVDVVESVLGPLRTRYEELMTDPAELHGILDAGAAKARSVAEPTLERAKVNAGLGRPR